VLAELDSDLRMSYEDTSLVMPSPSHTHRCHAHLLCNASADTVFAKFELRMIQPQPDVQIDNDTFEWFCSRIAQYVLKDENAAAVGNAFCRLYVESSLDVQPLTSQAQKALFGAPVSVIPIGFVQSSLVCTAVVYSLSPTLLAQVY
jgi:hypothetical protein